jgi:hypothetical protein
LFERDIESIGPEPGTIALSNAQLPRTTDAGNGPNIANGKLDYSLMSETPDDVMEGAEILE